jgi:hypothetical protein
MMMVVVVKVKDEAKSSEVISIFIDFDERAWVHCTKVRGSNGPCDNVKPFL